MPTPEIHKDADTCAQEVIERLGGRVTLGLPLGIGKAMQLTNALYRKAVLDSQIELSIYTALTLEVPRPRSEFEARFVQPMAARLYAGVPELEYVPDLRKGRLPQNVQVHEFYFAPGAYLGVRHAQQNHTSINYTGVARALLERGVNVVGQMVSPGNDPSRVSLSCNPDITLDLLDAARSRGRELLMIGEINPQLPFMPNDAVVPTADFAMMLDTGGGGHPLFPVPNRAASLTEYAIGLRVAGLVKDGGTLQIGIGNIGDTIASAIGLRHLQNRTFKTLLDSLAPHTVAQERDDLAQGLYAASEMLVEGFLHLQECGVLRREVGDGIFLHAGFYLGSAKFYARLRNLREEILNGISMTRISFTNSLYDDCGAKREQRRDARFVNSAMMVTLGGAVVSDGLADGQVVSGVGGQYDFVSMARDLDGARSIIVVPATRTRRGKTTSNIVWNYGHATIPRHLRDLVVTEYGVADLRNASDQEVIAALLNICDSRFQEGLRKHAVGAGKLSDEYRVPAEYRHNYPARLQRAFAASGLLETLPYYPLGTDLTEVEAELAVALEKLKKKRGRPLALARLALRGLRLADDPHLGEALERMALQSPNGFRERVYRSLMAAALSDVRASGRTMFPGSDGAES